MKRLDHSPRLRVALAFAIPSFLMVLAIPVLFRESGHRPVDPGNAKGGAILAAPLAAGGSGREKAAAVPAASPAQASPLPLPSEELFAQTGAASAAPAASASASASASVAPAAPAAGGAPASASMPASGGSLPPGSGAERLLAARLGGAGSSGGLNMGGSAGPASYQGGQMGQVQGYSWNQPKLKTVDSKYGARSVLGGGPNAELSGVSGAAIAGGGAPAGGSGGGMAGRGAGGFGAPSSAGVGMGGGEAGGAGGMPEGDSEGGDGFEGEKIPEIAAAEPLPPNPSNAQLEAARKKCDAAGQVYGPMMDQTGDYLSGLRGCDSKKCKRRARSACGRMNNIDCRNKRACPFTVNDACGNTCSI